MTNLLMFQYSNLFIYFPQGFPEMKGDRQMSRPARALFLQLLSGTHPEYKEFFRGSINFGHGHLERVMDLLYRRERMVPISLGADDRQTSTFQDQLDLPGGTQEAKPARSVPCSLGSMKPHSVPMFSLLLQCHNGTLDPWRPTVSQWSP